MITPDTAATLLQMYEKQKSYIDEAIAKIKANQEQLPALIAQDQMLAGMIFTMKKVLGDEVDGGDGVRS